MSILYSLMQIPGLGSLAGVSAIIALVWYIGPLLSIGGHSPLASSRNQLILTLVLIAGWGLYMLIRWLLARRKNAQMTRKLAEGPVADAGARSSAELTTIRKTFDTALAHLRKSRVGKKGQYLYQLPWYLIIGPPGSGKTTALVHSGLKFPLQNRLKTSKFKGIGGTRDCDWFVSDEAVLIDTAGRFFTQDSEEEVDRKVWQGFLKLLRQFRRRSPLNGAFVAVSLHDLMTWSEAERAQVAETTNQRLQELHRTLGIRFPVYILFTKTDLVAGFVEFFADLKADDRQQVWGVTWPLAEGEAEELPWQAFHQSFDALEERLHLRLIDRLQTERDPLSRDRIYTFPQQLRALRQTAETFLNESLQPDPHEPPWMVRGVYFTSGTQQGNPINQMIQQFAGALGLKASPLPRFGGKGKSYFLTRLLKEVVFPESGLSSSNQRAERRLQRLRMVGYAAVAVLGVGLSGLWLWSYANNQALISSTGEQTVQLAELAGAVSADDTTLVSVLPTLNAARALPGVSADSPAPEAWSRNFGLEQGHKLGEASRSGYGQLLESGLLPRLILYLEARLRSLLSQRDNNAALVAVGGMYRLLNHPQRLSENAQGFLNTVSTLLAEDQAIDANQAQALDAHLRSLILEVGIPSPLRPLALDQTLLDALTQVLSANQAQLLPVVDCQGPTITQLLGNAGAMVFIRDAGSLSDRVPCLYTQTGFQQAQQGGIDQAMQQAQERHFAMEGDAGQLSTESIQARYLDSYRHYWLALLDELRLACAADASDIQRIGDVLAGGRSSVRSLFEAVALHTGVDPEVQRGFSRIHQLLAVPEEGEAPLDALLRDLQSALRLPTDLEDRHEAMRQRARSLASFSSGLEEPHLSAWVASLAEEQRYIADRRGESPGINRLWESSKSFCVSRIDGHRPFAGGNAESVDPDDFKNFFGPGGYLASFVAQSHMRSFCQEGTMSLVRGDAQRQFCTGIEIMEVFFPGNRATPAHDIINPADHRIRSLVSGFRCPRCL